MTPINGTPAGGPGLGNSISSDSTSNTKKPAHVQAAIADLSREFIAECLLIVALKASHARDNILLGDDLFADRDIGIAIANLREAASSFRQREKMLAGGSK